MDKQKFKRIFVLVIAITAILLANISFWGIILKNDLVGRIIFGLTWTFIAIWWFGKYIQDKKIEKSPIDAQKKAD